MKWKDIFKKGVCILRVIKWFVIITALLILFSTVVVTPFALIGLVIFLFGLYQNRLMKQGKSVMGIGILAKPRWLLIIGLLFSFITALIFVEPVEETAKNLDKPKQEQKVKSETKDDKKDVVAAKKKAEEEKKAKEQAKLDAEKKAKAEKRKKEKEKQEADNTEEWLKTIGNIASSNKTKTEKFDEVSLYANDYPATKEEIAEFEKYIINEFNSGKYLSSIENDEYMLTNIFKSQAIEEYYDDSSKEPIDEFAFDFLQNTKYTYRGVDAVDSASVKSNERQMNKSLEKIQ